MTPHVKVEGSGHTPPQVHKAFMAAAEAQMRKAMLLIQADVVHKAPVKTGHLRRSITSLVVAHGNTIVGTVGTKVFYAPYLEEGTGIYGPRHRLIVPVKAKALKFPAQGGKTGGYSSAFIGPVGPGGKAGSGFTLAGRQRSGKAGKSAQWQFARSVRGIQPIHYFRRAIEETSVLWVRELHAIPVVAAAHLKRLGPGR